MTDRAVIFDLFGTLVGDLVGAEYADTFARSASVLAVDMEGFRRLWVDTRDRRYTGGFRTIDENIANICSRLGASTEPGAVQAVARTRRDYVRSVMLRPETGAVEVLSQLKTRGWKTGLISDCGPEVPEIWPDTALAPTMDVVLFSCSVGLKKPDPRIYELAVERLGVQPRDCLYVGNGGSHELDGALDAGMRAALLAPADSASEPPVIDGVPWRGAVISRLRQIPDLLREL